MIRSMPVSVSIHEKVHGCVTLSLYLKIRSLEMAAVSEGLDTGEGGDVSLNSKISAKRF